MNSIMPKGYWKRGPTRVCARTGSHFTPYESFDTRHRFWRTYGGYHLMIDGHNVDFDQEGLDGMIAAREQAYQLIRAHYQDKRALKRKAKESGE